MIEHITPTSDPYLEQHPGAVQDIEKARAMAKAANLYESENAALRHIMRVAMDDSANFDAKDGFGLGDIKEALAEDDRQREHPTPHDTEEALNTLDGDRYYDTSDSFGKVDIRGVMKVMHANNKQADVAARIAGNLHDKLEATKR